MGGYLICSRRAHDVIGERLSATLRTKAEAHGFSITSLAPTAWIMTWGPRPPSIRRIGPWMLVGDVIARRSVLASHSHSGGADVYERQLLARFWGRFMGVRFDSAYDLYAVLRDPSGALDVVAWSAHNLDLVASDIPEPFVQPLASGWRISADRLAGALQDPLLLSADLMFEGPRAVLPGTMARWPSGETITLWRPDEPLDKASSLTIGDAAARLASAVDEAVTGLSSLVSCVAAEVSGGLDSSIIAAGLTRTRQVDLWLNAWGPDPSADERPFVQALADRLEIDVRYVARRDGSLTQAQLEASPQGLRPSIAGMDVLLDQIFADLCREAGAEAIFTGKGGDSLFVQPADGAVFSDLWRRQGVRALASPVLPRLAALSERSIWTLAAHARRGVDPLEPSAPASERPTPTANAAPHPWLRGQTFGPGRARQLAGVVQGLSLHGPSLQTAAVDLFHPLLAQPVVETCLSLSTLQLTLGRRDRALARLAFADRLPTEIITRRSKGESTAFYGRMIADSLAVLRPWLLDGHLAALGLIDRDGMEHRLTRDSLIWRGGYSDILIAIAVEGWLRAWTSRLGR